MPFGSTSGDEGQLRVPALGTVVQGEDVALSWVYSVCTIHRNSTAVASTLWVQDVSGVGISVRGESVNLYFGS